MGTSYNVKLFLNGSTHPPKEIHQAIDETLESVNLKMSTYLQDSEISRLNHSQITDWIPLSSDTIDVISESLRISELSEGALDVTVGALVEAWGFGKRDQGTKIPEFEEINRLLRGVGFQKLHLRNDPPALRKELGSITVDLSAIAKGYAVDRVAGTLENLGIPNFMVEVGGEIRTKGHKPDGSPWIIAIEKPVEGDRSVQQLIALGDAGMATSGDYRNYFEKDGVRYSHTINPVTGKPITHRLASVSVVVPSCMSADGWATALMVLGPERGFAKAQEVGLAAYFIIRRDQGFTTKHTPQFEKYLHH